MYRESKADVPIIMEIGGEGVAVKRRDVLSYINNPLFGHILSVYNYVEIWGMPNGQGWANEPIEILEGITALKLEAKAIEYEEMTNASSRTSHTEVPSIGRPKGKK